MIQGLIIEINIENSNLDILDLSLNKRHLRDNFPFAFDLFQNADFIYAKSTGGRNLILKSRLIESKILKDYKKNKLISLEEIEIMIKEYNKDFNKVEKMVIYNKI